MSVFEASLEEKEATIDAVLGYINSSLDHGPSVGNDYGNVLSSRPLLLSGDHERDVLIVWRLLLDRWLPVIE